MTSFPFEFEHRYALAARAFGITPATTSIEVDGDELDVRFGPWRVRTGLDNVASVSFTGPYAFVKTAGTARLGLTDRGLTFATNSRVGLQLDFRRPIKGIEPLGLLRHPNLTVTPADPAGLARLIQAGLATGTP